MSDRLPLNGIRVLDFGAEVIKIEQPGRGDTLRGTPQNGEAGRPMRWLIDARNKKSVTLNLRVPEGQSLLRELVTHADIVVENFTPGTLEAWHLGWNDLSAVNPRLIMVRVSGYGQTGPYAKRPGYDRIALGFSGYMYPTGFPDRYPVRPSFPTADYNTATFGAFAAMLALYERDANGGKGQMIDLALYEAPFRITSDLLANFVRMGQNRDGRFVQIAAGGDNVWQRLAAAMDRAELADDPRYATSRERIARADELEALLAEWIASRDFAEVESKLVAVHVPVGGIYRASDIVEDPHFAARESVIEVEDPQQGAIPMPGIIPKLSDTPGRVDSTGPKIGAHNQEIYSGLLGRSEAELKMLRDQGII
jgi:crotonobetainyl-CoA:carnitine CoA-transferase CaiB-like acyl-CoA transferase